LRNSEIGLFYGAEQDIDGNFEERGTVSPGKYLAERN
jgi:hypothetical protein